MSDLDPALSALTIATSPVAALLRDAHAQRPVPHLQWTIGDLGKHMVSIVRAYAAAVTGRGPVGPDVWKIDENNDRLIAETLEASPPDLADALSSVTATFVEDNGRLPRSQAVPFYGNLSISASVQARVLLADRLVHWWDLATALGQRCSVSSELANLAVSGSFDVLPDFVVPEEAQGFTATYEIRLRGNPSRFLVFSDGVLTVSEDSPGRVDCRITADALAYALLAFGRTSRWRPIVRRQIVISGRRPWLANKLATVIHPP